MTQEIPSSWYLWVTDTKGLAWSKVGAALGFASLIGTVIGTVDCANQIRLRNSMKCQGLRKRTN